MGEFIVRALFLAHKLLLVSFFLSFNKVFESEVERELLLRRLYHLFILLKPSVSKPLYPLCWATFSNNVLCKFFFSSSSFCAVSEEEAERVRGEECARI